MKIAVCFKAVPDFDQVVDADWEHFNLAAGLEYVKRVFGCFDEAALETALRLRQAWEAEGEKTECTALTAAPLPSPLCKTLFAAGFDRVLDLSGAFSGESPEFQPRRVTAVLGNFLTGYDLILTGRQAGYADTGMVPLLLAENLGIPVLTAVEEIRPCGGGVEIRRSSDTGRERIRARLPLLAALGNSPVAALRAVTLSARMAASKRDAERPPAGTASLSSGEGEDSGEGPRFSRETRRKTCRFLPAGDGLARTVAEIRGKYLGGPEG
jgi:electron transfer flavoprotein alpha/beta subunit